MPIPESQKAAPQAIGWAFKNVEPMAVGHTSTGVPLFQLIGPRSQVEPGHVQHRDAQQCLGADGKELPSGHSWLENGHSQ